MKTLAQDFVCNRSTIDCFQAVTVFSQSVPVYEIHLRFQSLRSEKSMV